MPLLRPLAFGILLLTPPVARSDDMADAVDDGDMEGDELTDNQLRRLHKLMDLDGDGKLSLSESLGFSKNMGKMIASKDVGAILEEVDTSKDGRLSIDEHVADIQSQAEGGDEEEMREMQARLEVEKAKFAAADNNNDQHLDNHELTALYYPETHEDVLSVTVLESLKRKDKNDDSQLSAHEFWETEAGSGDDALTEEEMADFRRLDLDGNGFLNADEIRSWESGRFHTEEAMRNMIDAADKDHDMHLSVDEMAKAREAIAQSDAQYHLIEWAEHHEL
jgi:Ca2+-binding EF-hand superfamily protein